MRQKRRCAICRLIQWTAKFINKPSKKIKIAALSCTVNWILPHRLDDERHPDIQIYTRKKFQCSNAVSFFQGTTEIPRKVIACITYADCTFIVMVGGGKHAAGPPGLRTFWTNELPAVSAMQWRPVHFFPI